MAIERGKPEPLERALNGLDRPKVERSRPLMAGTRHRVSSPSMGKLLAGWIDPVLKSIVGLRQAVAPPPLAAGVGRKAPLVLL